jgi:hypothetical protein
MPSMLASDVNYDENKPKFMTEPYYEMSILTRRIFISSFWWDNTDKKKKLERAYSLLSDVDFYELRLITRWILLSDVSI